ncbi:MAG: hypothetical protein ACREOB_13055, partial [Thermodesulfobacteriota bacterium]
MALVAEAQPSIKAIGETVDKPQHIVSKTSDAIATTFQVMFFDVSSKLRTLRRKMCEIQNTNLSLKLKLHFNSGQKTVFGVGWKSVAGDEVT